MLGALSLASLIVIILSGTILALKGPGWWHFTSVGHFFNSVHLWAVELFFFFMVIHLWGKYWMAAWRGGRARVWITGAVTFLVAIPCALTGYVSQQNFDAQWISTQAKDGLNAVGVGAFFNVTNFGQMYSYHVFLLPVIVLGLVGAHILLVRRHGVVPPFELAGRAASAAAGGGRRRGGGAERGYFARWRAENEQSREWKGAYRSYDIVKEVVFAILGVAGVCVLLTVLFSSPDERPSTIAQWSQQMPADFVTTATSELDGSSFSADYGPPYNNGTGAVQHEWFIHLQKWFGVSHPINAAQDFVISPLRAIPGQPGLTSRDAPPTRRRPPRSRRRGRPPTRTRSARRPTVAAATLVPAGGRLRAGLDDDGLAALAGPVRRARRRAPDQPAVLPDRLHQAAAVPRGRVGARGPRTDRPPARRAVGHDERDGQLAGAGLAVALHAVVPGQAVLDER